MGGTSTAVEELTSNYPELEACRSQVEAAVDVIADSIRRDGTLLICGNGGSAADSGHIVGELVKGFEMDRPVSETTRQALLDTYPQRGEYLADHLQGSLPAISLTSHTAFLTAYANDVAPDMVFAQQVYGYGHSGDVLLGLSTSGNSGNVLNAVRVANAQGLDTVGLTGPDGGRINALCDVTVRVPGSSTAEIQERHLPVYHAVCRALEREFFE
jgi:D-sedoheptulose 7-phosphate isomerase